MALYFHAIFLSFLIKTIIFIHKLFFRVRPPFPCDKFSFYIFIVTACFGFSHFAGVMWSAHAFTRSM